MSAIVLLVLGAITALGFLGNLFTEKTRIPDTLLLIGVGLLAGPILGIVPPGTVRPFMPTFGAIALAVILFEGGLDLDLQHTIRQAGRAVLLAGLSFAISLFLIYYALNLGLQMEGRRVWAASSALACTSAPIVIPVLARLLPGSPMRPLLAVESALSDAIAVMVVLALQHLEGTPMSGTLLATLFSRAFAIGAGTALVAGVLWLWVLSRLYERKYFYLMTLGIVFLMMGGVELFHGSGAVAVLVFGIVLANGETLLGLFSPRMRDRVQAVFAHGVVVLHPRIAEAHAEVSFLMRSFFFVYLGVLFRWPGADMRLWLAIVLVIVAVLIGRQLSVQLLGWVTRVPAPDRRVLAVMLPRGLATAVLMSMLESADDPSSSVWLSLAMFVVVTTNIWMTVRLLRLPTDGAPDRAPPASRVPPDAPPSVPEVA